MTVAKEYIAPYMKTIYLRRGGISPGSTNPRLDPPLDARSVGCTSGGLRACEAVGGGVDSVQVLLQRLHVQGPKRWPRGEWGWLYILFTWG